MSRIVEGIKELLKGKDDDDELDYKYRSERRQGIGSGRQNRGYSPKSPADGRSGYPATLTPDGRSTYPVNAALDARNPYPASSIADARGGYPVNVTPDGRPVPVASDKRSRYPVDGRSGGRGYPADDRSGGVGYPADGRSGGSGYPADGRSGGVGYPVDGRSGGRGYPADDRSGGFGYPADGRSGGVGYPADGRSGGSGYPADGRSGGVGYPAEGRSGGSGYPGGDGRSGGSGYPGGDGRSGGGGYPGGDGRSGGGGYPGGDGRSGGGGYPGGDGRSGGSGYPGGDGRTGGGGYAGGDGRTGGSGYAGGDGRGGGGAYPADVRRGYPGDGRSEYVVDGGSGYATDGRSGYATDGRSGYATDGRSGYATDGRSGYPTDERNGYPTKPIADGRSGSPATSVPEVQSGYRRAYGEAYDDDYVRSSYDTRAESREYRQPGVTESSRVSESRRPYAVTTEAPRVELSPRGEYDRTTQQSPRKYGASGGAVIELMVPMCCAKCKEKVEEELREVDGVATIRCDPPNSRVVLTGDRDIDIDKCLSKAERAVRKKCELVSNQTDDGRREKTTTASGYLEAVEKLGILTPPPAPAVTRPSATAGSRPKLARMPSFASGKVTQYDTAMGPHGQDYEAKDYNSFRRMPSLGRHRNHDAEYITSFDQRAEPSDYGRHEHAPIRRMPSFNRHRHHDAEYITAADADRDYSPRSFYEVSNADVSYSSAYNDRPALLSQLSFSKVPVENPNYVKHIAY